MESNIGYINVLSLHINFILYNIISISGVGEFDLGYTKKEHTSVSARFSCYTLVGRRPDKCHWLAFPLHQLATRRSRFTHHTPPFIAKEQGAVHGLPFLTPCSIFIEVKKKCNKENNAFTEAV